MKPITHCLHILYTCVDLKESSKLAVGFLVNDQLDAQFFSMYLFNSLHVSSNLVVIIRRINYINTTYGVRHSVSVTASCAGPKGSAHETVTIRPPIQWVPGLSWGKADGAWRSTATPI
jgi:hypothetical protein